jgi:hypothetical protein
LYHSANSFNTIKDAEVYVAQFYATQQLLFLAPAPPGMQLRPCLCLVHHQLAPSISQQHGRLHLHRLSLSLESIARTPTAGKQMVQQLGEIMLVLRKSASNAASQATAMR